MCETQAICFTRAGFTLLGVNIDEYQVRYTRGENYFTMNRVKLCRCTTSFFCILDITYVLGITKSVIK
ncbi:hypothetical protein Hanom_Chr14g01255421 [Helianthus anomalus]